MRPREQTVSSHTQSKRLQKNHVGNTTVCQKAGAIRAVENKSPARKLSVKLNNSNC